MADSKPPFSDPEKARAAGRKSAERRAERERLKREDPQAYVATLFQNAREDLTGLLLDAAYGRGSFAGRIDQMCECGCGETVTVEVPALAPDKRLSAITKALEYAAGRPVAGKAQETPAGERPRPGLDIE